MDTKTKLWVALAVAALIAFIAMPKPDVQPPVAPAQPDSAESPFLTAIREGTADGIRRHVRENLWKRSTNVPQPDDRRQ